ncbi:MAG TPA: glycosyltransferase family 2 protein [Thermodesulfovibrionales bacterium]|jgi:GT2 family glycosyltransferase|nr:glycosyltransferase family 2 protein [Thermodesulfovibrionales bacterium]
MISVIIVNYRSAHLTARAVRSVSEGKGEREVIVIDNTSTAEERVLLHDLMRPYRVKLVVNDENVGFARANNQGFSISKGDLIFLLNPDAFVDPSCLTALEDFIEENPLAGSVSPQVFWDEEMKYLFPHYTYPSPGHDLLAKMSCASESFGTLYSLAARRENLRLWRSTLPLEVKNHHGGVVLLRRSSVKEAGGLFDERFFLFYEDTDLFFRLREKGYRLYTVPAAKAVHNYTHKREKLDIMARTCRLFYEKHYNRSLLRKITGLIPQQHPPAGMSLDCGLWSSPLSLSVPSELRDRYLFEWSPNPLFIPSIGFFGKGDRFVFSGQLWDFLEPGTYYSRISNPEKDFTSLKTLCWRKGE